MTLLIMLANEIQLRNFKGLTGFQRFMNQAASSLTDKKELRGAAQNDVCRQKGAGTRKLG